MRTEQESIFLSTDRQSYPVQEQSVNPNQKSTNRMTTLSEQAEFNIEDSEAKKNDANV